MLKRRLSLITLVLCLVLIVGMVAHSESEPFKVELTLFERFIVLSLLPPKASFLTMRMLQELQMELAPTNEEVLKAGLITDLRTGGVTIDDPDDPEKGWDKVEPKEIVFVEVTKALVDAALEKLDKEENITAQHMSVYIKFIIGEEKVEEPREDD